MVAGSSFAVSVLLLAAGTVVLYAGAELLVAGAGRLAYGLGIRAATAGVTIIAFATTAPELFVATIGAIDVSSELGLGTIIGSNVANIGLVLGLTALIRPLTISELAMRRYVPFMVLAAVLLVGLGYDGVIGRLEGVVLLVVLAGFTLLLVRSEADDPPPVAESTSGDSSGSSSTGSGVEPRDVAAVLGGLAALVLGSRWLVSGGTELLAAFGVSDIVIGLTVLALGTSLPELAASVVGAFRGETAFAIGNVVGSNIYNVLAVIGILAILTPIEVSRATITFEFPVLIAFTLVLVAMMGYGRRLSRLDGGALLVGYAVFLYLLFP